MSGIAADPDVDAAWFQLMGPHSLGEHGGLAESGTRRHQGDRVLPPLVNSLEQSEAGEFDVEGTRRSRRWWQQSRLIHGAQETQQVAQIPEPETSDANDHTRPAASKAARVGAMVAVGPTTSAMASRVFNPSPVLKTTVSASGSS